jgi:hypothetical protein
MLLPTDSVVETKRKRENDNKTRKSCKVMILDEKIKIIDKLRGGMCAVAVGPTLSWSFTLMSNFPLIFTFMLKFPAVIHEITLFVHK